VVSLVILDITRDMFGTTHARHLGNFREISGNVKTVGTMVSYPFALLEMFMLLVIVAKVDNKLRAKH